MKRQQAFTNNNKKFLKGGLHCHTTRSDGQLTPEETLIYAKNQGYDFMAITDHQVYNLVQFAPETGVLVIPGMEYGNDLVKGNGFRCFHTVCLGPSKEDGNGYEHDQEFEWGCAPNSEKYQPFLDDAHNKKNLTILCHPQWSNTSAKYFETQKGNFAMEVWNSGSAIGADCDDDAAYWDEILGQGKLLYGVATDDAHSYANLCKGWVMVKAQKDINSILEALKNGEFYSSCGPEIYDFYVDDGKACIDCSPVARVRLHSDMHPNRVTVDEEGNITHAEFDIENYWAGAYDYVRISIVDKEGKKAWTNPIFL
ncbi:MAG: hypothetical protein E7562_04280 [Ruminococcaceae bacterium]|nr:hypothetical protein [Oscillospiraceae bacterium]